MMSVMNVMSASMEAVAHREVLKRANSVLSIRGGN